jgi:hypothetical protein
VGPDREENPKGYLVFQFIRAVLLSTQGGHITSQINRLIKKKIKLSSYIRKFIMEQLQSHI